MIIHDSKKVVLYSLAAHYFLLYALPPPQAFRLRRAVGGLCGSDLKFRELGTACGIIVDDQAHGVDDRGVLKYILKYDLLNTSLFFSQRSGIEVASFPRYFFCCDFVSPACSDPCSPVLHFFVIYQPGVHCSYSMQTRLQ